MGKRLARLSCAHVLVDFCCALLLFARVGSAWLPAALVYNFCAFALQLPFGAVCDRRDDPGRTAALGCLCVAAGCFLPAALAAVCAGVGNALFHVGGGVSVLRGSERAEPLGVFVAPGAAGLFLGTQLGKNGDCPVWVGAVVLALCGVWLLLTEGRGERAAREPVSAPRVARDAPGERTASRGLLRCAALLFLVVVLRSCVGLCQSFPWKGAHACALLAALVLGKALGGLLCDRLGARRTALWTLLPAAALFLLSGSLWAGLPAVLLFNMTMPVTLWALARRLPGEEGFSFGLLTFALFVGYLPVQAGLNAALGGYLLALAALLSCALLLYALREDRA